MVPENPLKFVRDGMSFRRYIVSFQNRNQGCQVSKPLFLLVFVVNTVDEFLRITIDFSNGFDLVEFCCSII
jgi:hypothetical protein